MRCAFAICACLIVAGAGRDALAQDVSDPVAIDAGLAAVKDIKPLAIGAKQEYFYVIAMGPKQKIGYATVSLEAIKKDGETVYRYHNQSAVIFPTNARIVADSVGLLRTTFEPIEMETWRAQISPEGDVKGLFERAVVGPDKIVLTAEANGEIGTGEAARPEDPFVYGVESIIERIDWKKHTSFLIREFDVQSGGARDLNVAAEEWTDGSNTVVTRTPDGAVSYQFWFDRSGMINRWGEATMPVIFERGTRAEIDALIARIGPVERPKKTAKKPTGAATASPSAESKSTDRQD